MRKKIWTAIIIGLVLSLTFLTVTAAAEGLPTDASEEQSADLMATSGTCGDNLTWTQDDQEVLTISGTGEMKVYDNYNTPAPWKETEAKQVIIKDGVTSIGDYAFSGCTSLTTITIPSTIKTLGKYAFFGCTSLVTVENFENTQITILDDGTFSGCTSFTTISLLTAFPSLITQT